MNIVELADSLRGLDVQKKVTELYEKHSGEFLSANRDQMWNGKMPNGANITPGYMEDPYFKTKKQAAAYKKWKSSPGFMKNSSRDANTPNLFINGYFYRSLVLKVSDIPVIETNDPLGKSVAGDHHGVLGVSAENLQSIADKKFLPDFYAWFTKETGLTVQ